MNITLKLMTNFIYNITKFEFYHKLTNIEGVDPYVSNRYKINRSGKILDLKTGKFLSVTKSDDYPTVCLRDGNKVYKKRIHILLAGTFLYKPSKDHIEVDHIDRNKENYSLDNLRWVTRSENKKNRVFSNSSYQYTKVWIGYSDESCSKIIVNPRFEENMSDEFKNLSKSYKDKSGIFWKSYLLTDRNIVSNFKLDTFNWLLIPNSNNSYCSPEGLLLLTGRNTSPLITRGKLNDAGYRVVNIRKKILRVHRIVYMMFGNRPFDLKSKKLIDHKDTNRSNNRIENLKLVNDQKENLSNPNSRKNLGRPVMQYNLSGNFIKEFPSVSEANKELGVSPNNSNIINCCKGKQKTYKGYIWKYKN